MGINTIKTRWAIKSSEPLANYYGIPAILGEQIYTIFRHWTNLDNKTLPPLEEIKRVTREELTLYNIEAI